MPIMQKNEKAASSGDGGNFKSTPQKNGAYENTSRGSGLGQGMEKVIGTESVPNPFGK